MTQNNKNTTPIIVNPIAYCPMLVSVKNLVTTTIRTKVAFTITNKSKMLTALNGRM